MYVKLFTRRIGKARYITRATSIYTPFRRLGTRNARLTNPKPEYGPPGEIVSGGGGPGVS